MQTVMLEFKYTEAVAVQASLELTKSISKSLTIMPWLGAAFVILSLATPLIFESGHTGIAFFLFLFGISLLAIRFTVSRRLKRNFRNNPNANNIIRYRIDDEGVRIETEGSSTRFNWNRLIKVVEREEGFLLFVQTHLAHWIPKSAFEDQREIPEFRNRARINRVHFIS